MSSRTELNPSKGEKKGKKKERNTHTQAASIERERSKVEVEKFGNGQVKGDFVTQSI